MQLTRVTQRYTQPARAQRKEESWPPMPEDRVQISGARRILTGICMVPCGGAGAFVGMIIGNAQVFGAPWTGAVVGGIAGAAIGYGVAGRVGPF